MRPRFIVNALLVNALLVQARLVAALFVVGLVVAACGTGASDTSASETLDETDDGSDGEVGMADDETSDETSDDAATVDDGTPPPPIDLDLLRSGTWTLWVGGGPGGEIPIVDGWPITVTFGDGTLGGTAACNDYGASYRIDGRRLVVEGLGQNEAGCAPDVMASERAFFEALLDVDGIDLVAEGRDGPDLALSGMATEMLFVLSAPAPTDELVEALWLLDALLVDGEEIAPRGEPATLQLSADGGLSGSTGCRGLVGRYVVSGSSVLFNELGAEGECPASLRDQDGLVINVLGDGFTTELDGDTLILTSAGNEGLRYRAVTEDELEEVPTVPVESDAEALSGIEWVFAGGDGPDGPIADPGTVEPDAEITLVLEDGTFRGVAVCNSYSGTVDIGDGGRFTFGPARSTRASCGPDLDPIAASYLAALSRMVEGGVEADGARLVMNDGDATELHWERAG